jgi:thymidylate synthase ThyX
MEVKVTNETGWKRAMNAARRTVGKEPLDKEPSDNFKLMSLFAEHSQIKLVEYLISFKALRQWVGVHILRHPFVLPFIHSQREDRRELDVPRDELPQGALNDQDFVMNAQALINVSRKRLCNCASKETREAWKAVKDEIAKTEPNMAAVMVPNCIYRGFCPERESCGFWKTKKFKKELNDYRNLIGRGEELETE